MHGSMPRPNVPWPPPNSFKPGKGGGGLPAAPSPACVCHCSFGVLYCPKKGEVGQVNCAGLIQGSSDPKAQLGKAVSPVSTNANRWSRPPTAPSGPHDFHPFLLRRRGIPPPYVSVTHRGPQTSVPAILPLGELGAWRVSSGGLFKRQCGDNANKPKTAAHVDNTTT